MNSIKAMAYQAYQNNYFTIVSLGVFACGAAILRSQGLGQSCLSQQFDCVAVYNNYSQSLGFPTSSSYDFCYTALCTRVIIETAQKKFTTGATLAVAGFFGAGISLLARCIGRE
jgi:hypothetical protein